MISKLKLILFLCTSILLLSAIGMSPVASANKGDISVLPLSSINSGSTVYSIQHETYFSVYAAQNTTVGGLTSTKIWYVFAAVTYSNSTFVFPSDPDGVVQITAHGNLSFYSLAVTGTSIAGTATVNVTNGGEFKVSSPAQLISVIVSQNGTEQDIWSGYLTSQGSVSGYAYYNSNLPGSVILQYADGYSTANYSLALSSTSSKYSFPVSGIQKLSSSSDFTGSSTLKIPLHLPRRYRPATTQFNLTQYDLTKYVALATNSSSYSYYIRAAWDNASPAYLNDTLYPALVWRLSGDVTGTSTVGGKNTTASIPFEATAMAFYGVDGTNAGYAGSFYAEGSVSSVSSTASGKIDFIVSSVTVGVGQNVPSAGSITTKSSFKLNNATVVLFLTSNGQIETTANVTYSKSVYLETSGSLVQLEVNSSSQYYAIFSDGSSGNVSLVSPSSESNSTYVVNGTTHLAQKLNVSGNGYILVNAPISSLYSGKISVYKQTSQGYVEISTQDYTILNGHIQIFDDPSSTYYIVYSQVVQGSNSIIYILSGTIIVLSVLVAVVIAMRRRKATS